MTLTGAPRPRLRAAVLLPRSRIIFGETAVDHLGGALDFLEARRALVLCGPNAARGRTIKRVQAALGPACVGVFSGVKPHSPTAVVEEVARLVQRDGIDVLVSVGGGSTIDTAKGVAAMLSEGEPLPRLTSEFTPPDHYVERFLKKPKLPIVAIVTTLSGSEITPTIACRDPRGVKLLLRGDDVAARVVVLDPVATLDTPLQTFAESGMNGLAHGLEGLYSRSGQPLSDGLAMETIALFTTYLPQLVERPDDLEVRQQLLWASVMGGLVVSNARVGIHHAVCHCLGARLGLSHGLANALMLPYSMEFNLAATVQQQARAAAAMGVTAPGFSPEEAARRGIARLHELKRLLNVPARLRDLPEPPTREMLRQVAEDTMGDRGLYFNPRTISAPEEVEELLQMAW